MQVKLLLLLILVAACTVAYGWKVGTVSFPVFSGTNDNPDFNSHARVRDRGCERLGEKTSDGYEYSVFECDTKSMRYAWGQCKHCELSNWSDCGHWVWDPQGKVHLGETLFCDNRRLPMDASQILTYLGADPSGGYFAELSYDKGCVHDDKSPIAMSIWAANKCIKQKDGTSFKATCTGDEGYEIFYYNGNECSGPVTRKEAQSKSYCGYHELKGCNLPLEMAQFL